MLLQSCLGEVIEVEMEGLQRVSADSDASGRVSSEVDAGKV